MGNGAALFAPVLAPILDSTQCRILFDPGNHRAQIVGQPILAAAGFQPAFAPEGSLTSPKSRLKGGCGQDCPPHNKCRTSPAGKVCGSRLSVCRVPTPRDALSTMPGRRPDEWGRGRHECPMPLSFPKSGYSAEVVGQVGNLRRVVNPPGPPVNKPAGAGCQPARRIPSCPTTNAGCSVSRKLNGIGHECQRHTPHTQI